LCRLTSEGIPYCKGAVFQRGAGVDASVRIDLYLSDGIRAFFGRVTVSFYIEFGRYYVGSFHTTTVFLQMPSARFSAKYVEKNVGSLSGEATL